MIDSDFLFRAALAPAAALIWARYITWPVFILATGFLLVNKFKTIMFLQAYKSVIWWLMLIVFVTLAASLLLAALLMPDNDREMRMIVYFTVLLSLPVLIPCGIALFLKTGR